MRTGSKHTDEARIRMSLSHAGRKQTYEHAIKRAESRAANGNYEWTPERKAELSETMRRLQVRLGLKHSDATKAKMSQTRKGRKQNPEWIARRVAASQLTKSRKAEARNAKS